MTDSADARREARAKIVDAATQLLHEHGPMAVTTRGVADRAGVQAPAIYRLFGDKDGLLEAVAEHALAMWVSAKTVVMETAAAAEVDPLEDLRSGWQTQTDFGLANPALFRLLSDPDRAAHSAAAQSGQRVLEARVHRLAATGRLRVSERRAVDLIQAAGVGLILTLLSTPPEQRDPDLADAVYDAVFRQILTDPAERAVDNSRATAVTLRALAPQLDVLSEAEQQLMIEWLDRVIAKP